MNAGKMVYTPITRLLQLKVIALAILFHTIFV